jgi:hypothetical protein
LTRGPGAHAKTGEYALAALDHLGIGSHLHDIAEVREALEHARAIVEATAGDL